MVSIVIDDIQAWINQVEWPVILVDYHGLVLASNTASRDYFYGLRQENNLDNRDTTQMIFEVIPDMDSIWQSFVSDRHLEVVEFSYNHSFFYVTLTNMTKQRFVWINLIGPTSSPSGLHYLREYDGNAECFIYVNDTKGHSLYLNRKMRMLYDKNIIGLNRSEYLDKDTAYQHFQNDLKVISQRRAITCVENMQSKAGVLRFITHKFPIVNDVKEVIAVGGISIEITSILKQQHQHSLAYEILEALSEAVLVTNANHEIIYVNASFERITGYVKEKIVGKKPSILSSGRHNKSFYDCMNDTLRDRHYWEGEVWNKRADGQIYLSYLRIRAVLVNNVTDRYVAISTDISNKNSYVEQVEQQAFYDNLTGLSNRYHFNSQIEGWISQQRRKKAPFILMFMDLDYFKEVNDIYGHQIGDELLISVARRFRSLVRENDLLCRVGGDEFLVAYHDMVLEEALTKADTIVKEIAKPYIIENISITIGISVGVACYPDDADNLVDLMRYADSAMYEAKSAGRNGYYIFNQAISQRLKRLNTIKMVLNDAIKDPMTIQLYFQPKYDCDTQSYYGIEILTRLVHREYGVLMPDDFIPVALETRQMLELDKIIFEKSIQWLNSIGSDYAFSTSINMTVSGLLSAGYCQDLVKLVDAQENSKISIAVEILETTEIDDPVLALKNFEFLNAHGINIELDDFGAGYSSIKYLATYPISTLKIDRYFVSRLLSSAKDRSICQGIIALAKALDMQIIAEGVESQAEAEMLIEIGCYRQQGYLYAKPTPLTQENLDKFFRV